MNTIVIDCGASFIKGAVFQDGVITRRIRKHSPTINKGESLWKPVQIQALISMVFQMVQELSGKEQEVKLCISNEMHGFLLADQKGTPCTDYISWQKEYGAIEIEGQTSMQLLEERVSETDILQTGMPLRAGLPCCNLLYLLRSGYLNTENKTFFFYTLGDYLLKCLSGLEPLCHPSNAAATGLYHLKNATWNLKLIRAVGGENIIFPKIGIAEWNFEFNGLRVHVLPAIGDQQAALLGAGLKSGTELAFNLGTGAQVSRIVSDLDFQKQSQIRPYFYGKYLKTIPFLPSGRALNVYIRFFQDIFRHFQLEIPEEQIWKVLIEAEKDGSDTDLFFDMSFFENAVTDHQMGSIENIGEYTFTLGNLMHGILRQMGANFIHASDILVSDRETIDKLIFSGGIACKVHKIREDIIKHFRKNIKTFIAAEETFWGLYQYGTRKGI